jgi:hypothetical protein
MKNISVFLKVILFFAVISVATGVYFLESSPEGIVVAADGNVKGYGNLIRSILQGDRFWRGQLTAAQKALVWELSAPERQARWEAKLEKLGRTISQRQENLYQRKPMARPSVGEERAEALREEAERMEQDEMDQQLEYYRSKRIDNLKRTIQVLQMRLELLSSQVPYQIKP